MISVREARFSRLSCFPRSEQKRPGIDDCEWKDDERVVATHLQNKVLLRNIEDYGIRLLSLTFFSHAATAMTA